MDKRRQCIAMHFAYRLTVPIGASPKPPPIDAEGELIRAAPPVWHAADQDRSRCSHRQRSRFEYVTRWHYAGRNGREPREWFSQCEAALHGFAPFEERAQSFSLKHDEAGDRGTI